MIRLPGHHSVRRGDVGAAPEALCDMRLPEPGELGHAAHILGPSVDAVRAAFLRAGLSRIARVEWEVNQNARDKGRHFARCNTDGLSIVFAPETILLPPDTIAGVIAHEFGHAADFLYPGEFMLTADADWLVERVSPPTPYRRSYDDIERTADGIAEMALGVTIGYAGPCKLETLNAGVRPRPAGLR